MSTSDVKRYRKGQIIAGILLAHLDKHGGDTLTRLELQLEDTRPNLLAHLYTEATGKEVVYHKGGLFYGLTDTDDTNLEDIK